MSGKFIQPVSGIEVVSRAPRPGSMFSDEKLAAAASRVKGGEKLEDVALELALEEVAFLETLNDGDDDDTSELVTLGSWSEWLHPRKPAGEEGGGQFVANDQGALHQAIMDNVGQTPLFESQRLGGMHQTIQMGLSDLQDLKADIAIKVASRMRELSGENSSDATSPDRVASEFDTWAETSGDHQPHASAIQHVAKEMFAPDAPIDHIGQPRLETLQDPTVKTFLQAEYDITQRFLANHKVEHATLFRGLNTLNTVDSDKVSFDWLKNDGDVDVMMQPLSSWATVPRDAAGFAGLGATGAILVATVKAERIQSTSVTGRGCLEENEVILRGGKLAARVFVRETGESKAMFAERVGNYVAQQNKLPRFGVEL